MANNSEQLIKENAGGYAKVYPLAYIQGIIDAESGHTLTDVLSRYNHIYIPWHGSQEETRKFVPEVLRRYGLWLSYKMDNTLYTEWFKMSTEDAKIEELWINSENWEIVPNLTYINDASMRIPDESITPSQLSPALQQLISENKTINNIPDDEDLEQKCNVISFKDRCFYPSLCTGKGYKILRKNWTYGRNVLTQDMIDKEGTVYEIRYDFDLRGETIEIPEGCILSFKGGSIANGTLKGNNTLVLASKYYIFKVVHLSGLIFDILQPEWFGYGIDNFIPWGQDLTRFLTLDVRNEGTLYYNLTLKSWQYWDGKAWQTLGTGGGAGGTITGAEVTDVQSTEVAQATANLNGTVVQFTFGLPRGEQGEKGEDGKPGKDGVDGQNGTNGADGINGVDGIPGVSLEVRYCLGTESSYDGTSNPQGANPTGWLENVPTVTSSKPYIWCIQGKIKYSSAEDKTGTYTWSTPFRLSGTNGLNGTSGTSPIIYPAGIYDVSATYTADSTKAPYVLDTTDGNYYILNTATWTGTLHANQTPSQSYTSNPNTYWIQVQNMDAIFAKIGIIPNGLIGSAVFNGNYMFSQQGINQDGGIATDYENFNSSDPFNASNTFRPNVCINFATGEMWLGAGKSYFAADGSGYVGNKNIEFTADGDVQIFESYRDINDYVSSGNVALTTSTPYKFIINTLTSDITISLPSPTEMNQKEISFSFGDTNPGYDVFFSGSSINVLDNVNKEWESLGSRTLEFRFDAGRNITFKSNGTVWKLVDAEVFKDQYNSSHTVYTSYVSLSGSSSQYIVEQHGSTSGHGVLIKPKNGQTYHISAVEDFTVVGGSSNPIRAVYLDDVPALENSTFTLIIQGGMNSAEDDTAKTIYLQCLYSNDTALMTPYMLINGVYQVIVTGSVSDVGTPSLGLYKMATTSDGY